MATASVLGLPFTVTMYPLCVYIRGFPPQPYETLNGQLAHSCWQVSALGCRSFAVLFDDINCDMCPADAKEFPSFAHAQVTVTNDVYSHLDQPDVFLFCPTGILVLYRRTMCMCVAVLCRNRT